MARTIPHKVIGILPSFTEDTELLTADQVDLLGITLRTTRPGASIRSSSHPLQRLY
jgi:hypothetical protein